MEANACQFVVLLIIVDIDNWIFVIYFQGTLQLYVNY